MLPVIIKSWLSWDPMKTCIAASAKEQMLFDSLPSIRMPPEPLNRLVYPQCVQFYIKRSFPLNGLLVKQLHYIAIFFDGVC